MRYIQNKETKEKSQEDADLKTTETIESLY